MTLLTETIGLVTTRRCDAKCYDAQHPDCDCLCGGRNHGAGLQKAMQNTREIFLPLLEAGEARRFTIDDETIRILKLEQQQGSLFA